MRPPEHLDIGTSTYTVSYVDGLTDEDLPMDGLCHQSKRLIEVEKSLAPDYKKEVLLHEALHALMERVHFRELFLGASTEQEEHAVSLLTPVLLDLLRQNPQAVKYLGQKEPKRAD